VVDISLRVGIDMRGSTSSHTRADVVRLGPEVGTSVRWMRSGSTSSHAEGLRLGLLASSAARRYMSYIN